MWSTARPGRVALRIRNPVPILHEAGWDLRPVWTGKENVAAAGIRSPDRAACSGPCTGYTILAYVVTMATSNDRGNLRGHQCFRLMATEGFFVSLCVRVCGF